MSQKRDIDKTWPSKKIHLREAQDDLNSLPIAGSMFPNPQKANFIDMTDIVIQRLQQEQARLAHHHIQYLYSPTPVSYTAHVVTITMPPPAKEPVSITSYQ